MSGTKGNKRSRYNKYYKAHIDKGNEVVNEDNPIIQAFRIFSSELDDKHDRYERIVKINRDITIESKRIIFLLHSCEKEPKRASILNEAENRLQNLISNQFKQIAIELENRDYFQYLRAYTGGLQEFVEAYTFYHYIKNFTIDHWSGLEIKLIYNLSSINQSINDISSSSGMNEYKNSVVMVRTPLPAVEYILGVADLTGEIMRKCINCLGSGNIDDCFRMCNFVKEIYKGFLLVGNTSFHREINKKTYTLKQSLQKMEMVCYNIIVRGSEMPKDMLALVISKSAVDMNHGPDNDDDEGVGLY